MVDEVPWYLDDADVPDGERQGERLQKVLAQRGWGAAEPARS